MKPLSNPNKIKKLKKVIKIRRPDSVYSANNSITGYIANNIAFPLSYGSADL
jgi:hypothetical protein